jgi:hypothetical protein
MAQHEELARIKMKILALSNVTQARGASEAEATFAMEQVGRLLLQFNLTMDQVALSDEPVITAKVKTGTLKRAQNSLYMGALAAFCGCRVWVSKTKNVEYVYNFFGLESDVRMAVYLAVVIMRSVKWETEQYKKTDEYVFADVHRKRLTNSFQNGMGTRIAHRLMVLAANNKQEVTNQGGTTTALVVIAKDKKLDAEFRNTGIKLRTFANYTRTTERGSYGAGQQAGDRVNLSRPVTGKGGGQLLIGHDK